MRGALQGQRIWVTRPEAQAGPLCDLLLQHGASVLRLPLLNIAPPADLAPLDDALSRLDQFDVAIFVSPSALDSVFSRLGLPWPARLPVAVVGPGSTRRALQLGVGADQIICPTTRFDSEGLLAEPAMQRLAGQRVLLLRGDGGRDLLPQSLLQRGAKLHIVAAYRRLPPKLTPASLKRELDAGCTGIVVCSSEAAGYLFSQAGAALVQRLQSMQYFTPHPRIAAALARHGATNHVPTEPGDKGIVNTLCRYFNRTP